MKIDAATYDKMKHALTVVYQTHKDHIDNFLKNKTSKYSPTRFAWDLWNKTGGGYFHKIYWPYERPIYNMGDYKDSHIQTAVLRILKKDMKLPI